MRCPITVHILYIWPPAGAFFREFLETSGEAQLERKIIGACLRGTLSPAAICLFWSASCLLQCEQLSPADHSYFHDFLNMHARFRKSQTEPSEPLSQNKPFHFNSHTRELEGYLCVVVPAYNPTKTRESLGQRGLHRKILSIKTDK